MCGTLRRTPKFTPEASSIMLFGPGVTEVTKAKRMKAKISSRLMAVTLLLIRRLRPGAMKRPDTATFALSDTVGWHPGDQRLLFCFSARSDAHG
ncbi:hypothetical protein D3C71_1816530 [compost metagenome]